MFLRNGFFKIAFVKCSFPIKLIFVIDLWFWSKMFFLFLSKTSKSLQVQKKKNVLFKLEDKSKHALICSLCFSCFDVILVLVDDFIALIVPEFIFIL